MNIFFRRSTLQPCTVNQNDVTKNDIIHVINIYLWIHGIGFEGNFKTNFKNSVIMLLSFSLFFIFESAIICEIWNLLKPLLFENGERNFIFLLILLVVDWIIRLSLLLKRKALILIMQRVFDKYLNTTKQKSLNFKLVLIFALLSNDAFTISLNLYNCFLKRSIMFGFLENEFYFNFFRPSISTSIYYITKFLSFWYSTLLFIPIYFCNLCFALKHILLESTKELIRKKNMPDQYLFETYDEISKLISYVNRNMQSFLFSIFTALLLNIFYSAYNVVFT